MRTKAFLDTNVLVSLLEPGAKAETSRTLLAAEAVVSVQVLNELVHVCQRKKKVPLSSIRAFLNSVQPLLDVEPITLALHAVALDITERYGFSFYDSLIVAAALQAQCDTLYTEDLQDGQVIAGSLRIVNPFKPSP